MHERGGRAGSCAQSCSRVIRSRETSSRGSPAPPDSERVSGVAMFLRTALVPPVTSAGPANSAEASRMSWYRARTGTARGRAPQTSTITPPERQITSLPLTPRRSAPVRPAPAPRQTSPAARIRRDIAGCASASAR
jgi:hypothetical protein